MRKCMKRSLPVGYPYLSVLICAIDTGPKTFAMIVAKLNPVIFPCNGETKIVLDQSLYDVSSLEIVSWCITYTLSFTFHGTTWI